MKAIWRFRLLCFGFFILFMGVAYLPALPGPFFPVDDAALIEPPQLQPPVTAASLATIFTVGSHIDYYPVRDLSYLVDRVFWPESPTLYRVHQMLWFLGVVVLLAGILARLGVPPHTADLLAIFWGIHPYHAETLMWISARKDVLALFFGLASVYVFLRAMEKGRPSTYLISIALFALSLLSKASFGPLPFVALFGAWLGIPSLRRRSTVVAALGALAMGLGSSLFQAWFYSTVNDMRSFVPPEMRIASSLTALGKMGGGWILPSWNVLDNETFGEWADLNRRYLLPGLLFLAVFAGSAVFSIFRKRTLNLLWLACVAALYLPISGWTFPHREFYSVRYFEPAAVVLIPWLLYRGLARLPKPAVVAAAVIGFALAGWSTVGEANVWSEALWVYQKALAGQPRSLSLRGELFGEAINAARHPVAISPATGDESLLELRVRLDNELGAQCRDPAPVNCSTYFRYRYYLSEWGGDSAGAAGFLARFARAQSLLSPRPRMAARLQIGQALLEDQLDARAFENWLQTNRYLPNAEYRALDLVLLCLVRPDEVKERRDRWIGGRLLTRSGLDRFAARAVSPRLLPKIRNCLEN